MFYVEVMRCDSRNPYDSRGFRKGDDFMKKSITINTSSAASFKNHASFCIGTGRMGLALQEEYQKQLSYVQSGARFSHIRGHGLFSDDMAIYHNFTNKDGEETESYCFTYLDRVMD